MGLMKIDNASRQVIEMTSAETTSYVRFYFRPKTPTQYHNEGFKHSSLRYDGDTHANVPVPIFFLLDLETLLEHPHVLFSETHQAGSGSPLYHSPEDFASFNFHKIYSSGSMTSDEKAYRHAEILIPNYLDITPYLKYVFCRNTIEKTTLLNLLKQEDSETFKTFKEIIKIPRKETFENNGLYVTECVHHQGKAGITFSDSQAKEYFVRRQMQKLHLHPHQLAPVEARAEFDWIGKSEKLLYHDEVGFEVNYAHPKSVLFQNLKAVPLAEKLHIKIYLEHMLVCFNEYSIAESEML